MIKAKVGNLLTSIEEENIDCVLNAANGIGYMPGGLAGAIKKVGGRKIENDAVYICKIYDPQPGYSYCTIPGKLEEQGVKIIIHAVTMKNPGGKTSYKFVEDAFISSLKMARSASIKTLGCTALGTGVGGLDSKKVASIMIKIAKEVDELYDFNIVFIDFDETFIQEINKNLC